MESFVLTTNRCAPRNETREAGCGRQGKSSHLPSLLTLLMLVMLEAVPRT